MVNNFLNDIDKASREKDLKKIRELVKRFRKHNSCNACQKEFEQEIHKLKNKITNIAIEDKRNILASNKLQRGTYLDDEVREKMINILIQLQNAKLTYKEVVKTLSKYDR